MTPFLSLEWTKFLVTNLSALSALSSTFSNSASMTASLRAAYTRNVDTKVEGKACKEQSTLLQTTHHKPSL